VRAGAHPTLPVALFRGAGLVLAAGMVLALVVPILGLRSDDCGPLSCGLVQAIGKALAAGAVGLGFLVLAVVSVLRRGFSAAVLALFVALPALLFAATTLEQWRRVEAGADAPTIVIASSREFAARQGFGEAASLRGFVYNGRADWLSVKLTSPAGLETFVIQRRRAGEWSPVAAAPRFTRDELRELGAPTDLMREPS